LYRDIRLEGLRCNPEAFGSRFEAENARPLTFFSERLGGSAAFGAFHGSELVGIAGLLIREGQKEAHKGLLVGMYVRPSARKAGTGRRLVETIIEFARHRVELIQLAVVSENKRGGPRRAQWQYNCDRMDHTLEELVGVLEAKENKAGRRMRPLVVLLITQMPKRPKIETGKLYSVIYAKFPAECRSLGFTDSYPIEEKWKNQVRYGLWDARDRGLIKHVGTPKSGQWERL